MFLFSVKVMEEVKSDALYEFQPPFNILAGIIVWPCSLMYPSKVVGKVSRVLLRVFYFPELVFIWLFEVLIMRKQSQYLPLRPGIVKHDVTYGSNSLAAAGSTIGGGVARRRQDIASTGTATDEQSQDDPTSSLSYSASGSARSPPQGVGSSATASAPVAQQMNRLNTQGLEEGSSSNQDVLSPYFENIRRFRDASKVNSASDSSTRSEGEANQDRPVYSYQPTAPIGMGIGIGRHGSVSGYHGKVYQGTEATLANTFQGVWPSYGMVAGGYMDPSAGESFAEDPYPRQQSLHQGADAEELSHLIEDRFTEMRIRMEEIDSKLDRLMNAILVANGERK